jgi:hypothetical protein
MLCIFGEPCELHSFCYCAKQFSRRKSFRIEADLIRSIRSASDDVLCRAEEILSFPKLSRQHKNSHK